ncbi:hypothetical protein OGX74_07505 [Citrobacter sp. CK197]|uniref:hypothetical protein n=1 Tax=Citrobacter TaxID=544 RepID=UPI001786CAC5|nr:MULTISPECIES: hypothetical protein [Citrobacter]MBE0023664.1 hypothetical protein [Citrobacter koseri]MBE0084368.1 hypothetical protein [Citrobacter koseri]MDM2981259.1 hypothetical protein [Citrobacter sp. CK197]HEM6831139.1 hypothetical protein [Citrobacter koseri]
MAGICIIEGCGRYADKIIGVRLRRELEGRNAIWAPDTEAYLCDEHAAQGYDVRIELTPRDDKTVRTVVSNADGDVIEHLHTITKPVNTDDPQ